MLELECRGARVALICSDAFLRMAQAQMKRVPATRLQLIVIDHPLGGLPAAVVQARADQALPQLLRAIEEVQRG